MAQHISQVITAYPTPPNSETDNSTEFNAKADAYVAHQVVNVPQVNNWATQANEVANDINNASTLAYKWAENPEDSEVEIGKYSAKHWATKAQETVATIPVGTINDDVLGPAKTFSSQRIAQIGGRKNYIINGDFRIWQRGISFTNQGNGEYSADRWWNWFIGGTITKVNFKDRYGLKGEASGSERPSMHHSIENVYELTGKTVTFSFTGITNADNFRITYHVEPSQDEKDVTDKIVSLGNDRYSVTFDVGTALTTDKMKIGIGTIAATDGNYEMTITNVQLEVGEVATDFEYIPISEELARCHRYYYVTNAFGGASSDAWESFFNLTMPTSMRVSPTVTISNSNFSVKILGTTSLAAWNHVAVTGEQFMTITLDAEL